MTKYPYILFNQSPEDLRRIGARGGRAYGRNRRRGRPSRVPFPAWKPPPKRSRSWMRSFPGCVVRASPVLGGDLVRRSDA